MKAEVILKDHGLRVTPIRKAVLDILGSQDSALSQGEIELNLVEPDRITVYRTLNTFENSGIIHKVFDGTAQLKYAICNNGCSEHIHDDEHIHFQCTKCGNITCLEETSRNISVPENYTIDSTQIIVKGTCPNCN